MTNVLILGSLSSFVSKRHNFHREILPILRHPEANWYQNRVLPHDKRSQG